MQVKLFTHLVAVALISLAGCLSIESPESDPNADGESPDDLRAYTPINRQGSLDVVYPNISPPRDSSPVCQLIDAASSYRVLNLNASIAWSATSDRTQTLRLELRTAGSANDVSIEGQSPLELAAAAFNVTAGQKFGLVISLVGNDPSDPVLLEPQTADFAAHFVAERAVDEADGDLGIWTNDCPS